MQKWALTTAAAGATPALCAAWAASDAAGRPRLLLRAQRLAELSLEALAKHAAAFAPVLAAPPGAAAGPAAALARCVVALTDRASWRDGAAADAVVARLLRQGALRWLRVVILAAAPPPAPGAPPAPASELGALAMQLLARAADVAQAEGWAREPLPPPTAQPPQPAQAAVLADAAALLSVPLLLRRCGGCLAGGNAVAVWHSALSLLPPEGLTARLARAPPAGGAYPHQAWLLGTLLEAAPAAAAAAAAAVRRAARPDARPDDALAASSARDAALRFAATAQALLPTLPPGAMGTTDEDGAPYAAGSDGALLPPPPELAAQLALLSDGAMLRDLAHVLRPAPSDGGLHADFTATAAAAVGLCALLNSALSRLRGAERGRLLSSLAFAAGVVPRLWACVRAAAAASGAAPLDASASALLPLAVLAAVYSHALLTADDEEFYERGHPLPLAENARLVILLRDTLWHLLWADGGGGATASAAAAASSARAAATEALARLFQQLHARNARRAFAPPDAFFRAELARHDATTERLLADAAAATQAADEDEDAGGGDAGGSGSPPPSSASRAARLLAAAPALAPFALRAELFRELCAADREAAELRAVRGDGFMSYGPVVTVRRDRLFEDGLRGLGALPAEALRGRVRIQFVNALGAPEAGVDGGGLFKDFLDDLVRGAFDPSLGLWRETEDHALYPDPAGAARDPEHLVKLRFQGAVLGKALREGILAELPLAAFFLARLRGDALGLDDLASMDARLHRSLLQLKRFEGDHAALCLSFTVARDADGAEVPLMPRGAETAVTADNKRAYIQLVAHFKLVAQLRQQVDAFLAGFHALVRPSWVRMFAPGELGQLIGGSREGLSVPDLRRWAVYSGGFYEEHPTVLLLWQALEELQPQQQAAFLKFVTAVSRPPLLGFRALEPRFCVHRAGVAASDAPDESADTERLPTAATCMVRCSLRRAVAWRAVRLTRLTLTRPVRHRA